MEGLKDEENKKDFQTESGPRSGRCSDRRGRRRHRPTRAAAPMEAWGLAEHPLYPLHV